MTKLTLSQKLKIAFRAAFHKNTPLSAKAVLGGGLLYGLLPIDLIPDLLPLLGIADDATILLVLFLVFLHMTKDIRKELAQP